MAVSDLTRRRPRPPHALFFLVSTGINNNGMERRETTDQLYRFLDCGKTHLLTDTWMQSWKTYLIQTCEFNRPKKPLGPKCYSHQLAILGIREEKCLFAHFQWHYGYIRRAMTNKKRKRRTGYENRRFLIWPPCCDVRWLSTLITIPDCISL